MKTSPSVRWKPRIINFWCIAGYERKQETKQDENECLLNYFDTVTSCVYMYIRTINYYLPCRRY